MNNYLTHWYKTIIRNGLKTIKLVLGLGISFGVGTSVNLILGILIFGWVLVDSLITKTEQ
jgi:hypothetical protein